MRRRARITTAILVVCFTGSLAMAGGELYGTVVTADGRKLTGPIRWDVNENFWDDSLNALKSEPIESESEGFRFKIFGLKLGAQHESHGSFSIPFGHLRSIENKGREALLTLKNGEVIEVQATSDLGRDMRGLVIEDREAGSQSLEWYGMKRVDFRPGPGEGRDTERLYGTVETETGEITGFIIWDRDESLLEDVLDGEADGEDHEIRFSEIASIERRGSRTSSVTLKDETILELSGTNDVNDDNRGVIVAIPGFGALELQWEDIVRVRFAEAPASPTYERFDGGRRLTGSIRTRDGQVLRGEIVWDRDESWSWETLDGDADGIDYSIPFDKIRRIAPHGDDATDVVLRSGKTLRLSGTNDVNDANRGILVIAEAETHELEWSDIKVLDLD